MPDTVQTETLALAAADGRTLAGTLWLPAGGSAPRLAVAIAPATAVPRRLYDAFARHLAARGHAVATIDYRGVGDSAHRPLTHDAATMAEWGTLDLPALLDRLAARWPGTPLALVGHSVGGQLLGLAHNRALVAAMAGIAAQSGYWGNWPAPVRYLRALQWHLVVPGLSVLLGRLPGFAVGGTPLPAGVARQWAAWCRLPGFIRQAEGGRLAAGFGRWSGPMRLYSIGDDAYAPARAVDALAGFYTGAQVERRHLSLDELGVRSIGHFGFFSRRMPASAWDEVAEWLEEKAAGGAALRRAG